MHSLRKGRQAPNLSYICGQVLKFSLHFCYGKFAICQFYHCCSRAILNTYIVQTQFLIRFCQPSHSCIYRPAKYIASILISAVGGSTSSSQEDPGNRKLYFNASHSSQEEHTKFVGNKIRLAL